MKKMTPTTATLASLMLVGVVAAPYALAQDAPAQPPTAPQSAQQASPQRNAQLRADPRAQQNATWISLNGTVESVEQDRFRVNYGAGSINVAIDDQARDAEAYELAAGDKVIVNGVVDQNLMRSQQVEATSVFIEKINTTFYKNPSQPYTWALISTPIEEGKATLEGIVTNAQENQFSIGTGTQQIAVNVAELENNPLDQEGYQKIQDGDRVRVSGALQGDLASSPELTADSVVSLKKQDQARILQAQPEPRTRIQANDPGQAEDAEQAEPMD